MKQQNFWNTMQRIILTLQWVWEGCLGSICHGNIGCHMRNLISHKDPPFFQVQSLNTERNKAQCSNIET